MPVINLIFQNVFSENSVNPPRLNVALALTFCVSFLLKITSNSIFCLHSDSGTVCFTLNLFPHVTLLSDRSKCYFLTNWNKMHLWELCLFQLEADAKIMQEHTHPRPLMSSLNALKERMNPVVRQCLSAFSSILQLICKNTDQ